MEEIGLDTGTSTDELWARYPHLKDINLSHAMKGDKALSPEMYDKLRRLIIKHQILWDPRPKQVPGGTTECSFDVKPGTEWSAKWRPMSKADRDALLELTDDQLAKEVIEPSTSKPQLCCRPYSQARFGREIRYRLQTVEQAHTRR